MPFPTVTSAGPIVAAPWRRGSERDDLGEAFVSHTVFRYDRWRDLPQIGLAAEKAARLFARTEGSAWLLQWVLPGRRLMGDLSIWRSEEHLQAFLVSPDHVALVSHWRDRMHGTHHSWTAPVERAEIWTRARSLMH